MTDQWPKLKSKRTTKLSPWADIIEREVEFTPGAKPEIYHAVGQPDYIAMLAMTPGGKIPIVRQYRPAIESFTWELPAGTVDEGESAIEAASRELMEETGLPSRKVHPLGTFAPCSGRLANKVHSFFIEAGDTAPDHQPEAGIEVRLVTPAELARIIKAGQFDSQQHLGTLLLARLHSFLDLPVA